MKKILLGFLYILCVLGLVSCSFERIDNTNAPIEEDEMAAELPPAALHFNRKKYL